MDENFSTFSASLTSVPYQYQTIGRHCECDVEHTLALSVRTISRARTLRQNVDVRNGIFAILIRNGAVGLALACVRTYLYQCFHPRSYLLRVSPNKAPTFRVDLWQENTIYAYLEDDITGAYDQENIQLVVNAANGPIVKPGVKFLAAREKRPVDLAPNLTKQNEPLFAATRQVSQHDAFVRVEGSETRSVTSLSPTCAVDNPDFRDGGVDSFRLPALRSGWIAAGYEYYVGPTGKGQGDYQGGPGRRQTLGKYKVYWSPPEIQMFWATFNSLSDPPCPSADEVWSYTAYELRVFIEGPRGTQAS